MAGNIENGRERALRAAAAAGRVPAAGGPGVPGALGVPGAAGMADPAAGRIGPIDSEAVRKARGILQKYKSGKVKIDEHILECERWYRLHRDERQDPQQMDSGWLFNSLANKHADFMDNYPEPNVLPRAQDDEQAAMQLTGILPVVLEQNDYEQIYSDAGWDKLKYGASCKLVCWDPGKSGGLGDVSIRNVELLNLFWQPGVTDLQASRNVFHVELLHNDTIRERWPFVDPKDLGGPEIEQRYRYDKDVDTSDMSTVVDWYYKRNGRLHYCKFVGDTVLWASENHPAYAQRGFYDHGLYPFVLDVLYPLKGTPIGFGAVDVMMGRQQVTGSGPATSFHKKRDVTIKMFAPRSFFLPKIHFDYFLTTYWRLTQTKRQSWHQRPMCQHPLHGCKYWLSFGCCCGLTAFALYANRHWPCTAWWHRCGAAYAGALQNLQRQ